MRFYADLHIHSKHSRATSADCDLESLSFWAQKKGISVIGTGDFTHPGWRAELEEKLVPAEPGLFRLRPELEKSIADRLGGVARSPIRFMLSVEISSIYKRDDRTRKVHNLIYAPDFARAKEIVDRLERIGNLRSDGRPILGLDSRDLLEITLEAGGGSYLVPAHVWTPWFSALGSKSGFDEIDACFADLSGHVFALETGLSSDPSMNWRLSQLDRFRLVSSSDAHSPQKLGREATVFDCDVDYFAIRRALETGAGFGGTVEFFPEEGKYHLDGHRKCEVRLEPGESRALGGACPACGKPMTLGVLNRVDELADRPEGFTLEGAAPFRSLVPLAEVLAEVSRASSSSSVRVARSYEAVIASLGPELWILESAPLEEVERDGRELLAEAIRRMRDGRVLRESGYDGEYGIIRMFAEGELDRRMSLGLEATPKPAASRSPEARPAPEDRDPGPDPAGGVPDPKAAGSLDPDQAAAASSIGSPLLIIAGPGTGKTRTLTHRIAHLVRDHHIPPERCLAITFTRRAAEEMRERLETLVGARTAAAIEVRTFHGLGRSILCEHAERLGLAPEVPIASDLERAALLAEALDLPLREAERWLEQISRAKRGELAMTTGSELEQAFRTHERILRARGLVDHDDLLAMSVELLENEPELRGRFTSISIDEYQDLDVLQYRLIRLLTKPDGDVCAIGDPDQAIYRFRGGDVRFFVDFAKDFTGARTIELGKSYRSTPIILEASTEMIRESSLVPDRNLTAFKRGGAAKISLINAPSEAAEAEQIVHEIEKLIGGYSFFSVDSGRVATGDRGDFAFADIAILYRTAAQLEPLETALERSGIPFQRRSHDRLLDKRGVRPFVAALARDSSPADKLGIALADSTLDERDREMLTAIAARAGDDWSRFFADLSTATEVDTWDPRADRVSLLTLHASKGLEFDVVFLAGCEDGLLPHRFSPAPLEPAELAEERRLFYVGMTRAKSRLYVARARRRFIRGAVEERSPSPFLAAIPGHLIEQIKEREARRKPQSVQMALF